MLNRYKKLTGVTITTHINNVVKKYFSLVKKS